MRGSFSSSARLPTHQTALCFRRQGPGGPSAGRGQAESTEIYRGLEVAPELAPKVRLDIACNDDFVQTTIDAILTAARRGEGEVGDGKIFVTELQQCIRIRTGESGGTAI